MSRSTVTRGHYVLDDSDQPVPEPDVVAWSRWMDESGKRIVGRDEVGEGVASTVYLGFDRHIFFARGKRYLWETMVFGGPLDGEGEQYASLVEARQGHGEWVARMMAAHDAMTRRWN